MNRHTDFARDLSLNVLRRYLNTHGWVPQPFAERKFTIFTLPGEADDDAIEIVLPTIEDPDVVGSSVFAAVRTISQIQDRSPDEVAQDIRSIAFDIMRSRVPDEYVYQDSIELRLAVEFVEGMKGVLSSTASTELNPDRYFSRTRKEAIDYAGSCRFGHTFRGSFGFLIESPVGLNNEPTMFGMVQDVPFSRRVVQRLVKSFQVITDASRKEDVAPIVDSYGFALNANMCDDIADLIDRTNVSKIMVRFDLSPEWHIDRDLLERPTYSIGVHHVDILRTASKTLRAQEKTKEVTVVGRIKRLETDGNPADLLQDNADREISINWDSDDFGHIRVRVFLEPEDYLVAVEAHKLGRYVSINGTLERQGRIWTLENPENLSILPV